MLSFFTTTFATAVRPVRTATTRASRPVRTATTRAASSRARVSPRRTRRRARTIQLATGLVAVGVGVGLLIRADLGVASWDVLHVALAERTGGSVGTVSALVGVAAAGLATALGERPRPGTLVPLVVIAPTLDLVLAVATTPTTLGGQVAMLAGGMSLMAVGVGAYVASDHGAGPGDLVFLGLAKRGMSVGAARLAVDGTAVTLGWLLGGPLGIGTVLVTIGLGPMIATTIRVFDLAPSRAEVDRRDRDFHRAVALELHQELEGV